MSLQWEGMVGTMAQNVFFTEGPATRGEDLGAVEVRIDRHNASLDEVKEGLARRVQSMGGNLLAEFRYGQQAHKWHQRFRWDEESWFGTGRAYWLE